MYKINYEIRFEKSAPITGMAETERGAWRLTPVLPRDKIVSARAEIPLAVTEDERIFINGYQTWTFCPEYTRGDKIPGVGRFPKFIVDHYGMDRYGDYHFVDYPRRAGLLHGESWCYFRRGEDFRLIASLSERAGYTLFTYDAPNGLLTVQRD